MKLDQFAYLYSKPHGNIMEFCQSKKVGTLRESHSMGVCRHLCLPELCTE